MARTAGRITTLSEAIIDAAMITVKSGRPDPPVLHVVLAIRYPTPIHVPAHIAAVTVAPARKRLRLIPATPANVAATGFNSGRNRAPS